MNEAQPKPEKSFLTRLGDTVGSIGLSVVLLSLLLYLTWRGTTMQVEYGLKRAQEIYFDSWIAKDPITFLPDVFGKDFKLRLPGGYLVLAVLFVNLLWGGIIRLRKRAATVGILITHIGIIVMLVASFVKFHYSFEGYVRVAEGKTATDFVSFTEWELAIGEDQKNGKTTEWIIPESELIGLRAVDSTTFDSPDLPFTLAISNFLESSKTQPEAPMVPRKEPTVDGFVLIEEPWDPETERNVAGCIATLTPKDGGEAKSTLLYGYDFGSTLAFPVGDRTFTVELRRIRFPLPFTLRLDELHQSTHPGVRIARDYSSDVTRFENGSEKALRISMNEPMRHGGYVFFQSKVGPPDEFSNGGDYSIFQVVSNPSDQWPLYSCIILAIGLVIHFGSKLTKFALTQFARRATA